MSEAKWGLEEFSQALSEKRESILELKTDVAALERAMAIYQHAQTKSANGVPRTSPHLADVLYQLLSEAGQPVHRKKLLEDAQARGCVIGGKDTINTLTAHMSNDPRFESTKGDGMWGLAEWAKRENSRTKAYQRTADARSTTPNPVPGP